MSRGFLTILAMAQGAILLLLFLLLLWNRVSQWFWVRRRERKAARLADLLKEWCAEQEGDESLLLSLNAAPIRVVRRELEKAKPMLPEDRWEKLVGLARSSTWFHRVRKIARSHFWWRRMDAAEALGLVGRPEDDEMLLKLLEDPHSGVEMAALTAARELKLPTLLEPLLSMAVSAGATREDFVLHVLLDYGPLLVPLLDRHLRGPDNGAEATTLLKLAGRLGAPELVDDVLGEVQNSHLEVRIIAVRALSSFAGEKVGAALHAALSDEAWQVRAQAASGLGLLIVPDAEADLMTALADHNWWVRLRAALALRRFGDSGVRRLERIKEADDAFAYDMAQYVLRLDDAAVAEYIWSCRRELSGSGTACSAAGLSA
jgi:hypothetical protein